MNIDIFEKALKVFRDIGITSKPKQNFNLWIVSENGDIVSVDDSNGHYRIFSYQILDEDWIEHMKEKWWVSKQDEIDLTQAINFARTIVNK